MTPTLLITLRDGGVIELTPEDGHVLVFEVVDKALVLSNRYKERAPTTFRIFAHGVWADIEAVD
jgi:hypothetical protein